MAMYEETISVLQSAAEKARLEGNEENKSLFTIAADSIRILSNRVAHFERENTSKLFGIEYDVVLFVFEKLGRIRANGEELPVTNDQFLAQLSA